MSLGDKFTSGYRGINAFNSGVIKLLVARENDWIEEKLSAILTQSPRIDFEPLIASIVFGRTEGKTSLFKNVECIVPGCSFKIDHTHNGASVSEYIDWNAISYKTLPHDPAEILFQSVSEVVNRNQGGYFVVRLSGGMDSTGILLSLMEAVDVSRIIAITYRYLMGTSNQDEVSARHLCKIFGIRQIIIDIEPHSLFHRLPSPVPPVLNMRTINFKVYEEERKRIGSICGDNYTLFDGHGGDHVFCEKIPFGIIKELFFHGSLLTSCRKLLQIARLHGINMKDVLLMHTNSMHYLITEAQCYFSKDVIKNLHYDRKTVSEERKSALQEAILDNGTSLTLSLTENDIFPFTDQRMIGYGLKLRVEESFDTTSKRLQYRKAINDRYKFVFTRKDKGHITGAYQSALSVNKDRVINLLRHGQFATHGLLNLEGVERAIETSSHGIGGVSFILMKLIAAELIFEGYL
ncbi:hypothetical protein MWW83_004867 [Escherichia coli]|nr:hypothetical protein [Escherichia coli]EJA8336945.1 hypothetical protein [Escherichia coli]